MSDYIPTVDRTTRGVGITLIGLGISAMMAVMYMSGRFGWSLQNALEDQIASAALHVLSEGACGTLVASSALVSRWIGWRYKFMSASAFGSALLLIGYSILSVNGFMATRIAHLKSHGALVDLQKGHLDWMRKSAVNPNIPKGERSMLRKEAGAATEELRKSLIFVPDAQASSIADFFGSTTEKVQRMLVLIASCIGQFIKVVCLYFGFSIYSTASRGSRASDAASFEPDARTQLVRGATSGSDAGSRDVNAASDARRSARPSLAERMSQARLEKYLDQFTSGRKSRISQRQMADETGWSQSTMSRRLKKRSSTSK